jgi:photosystem II stability/assembly factor-like uncharacterized protein
MRLKIMIAAWLVIPLVFGTGCSPTRVESSASISTKTLRPPQGVTYVETNISESNQTGWKVSVSKLNNPIKLSFISFLDGERGWAGGRGGMYQTSDGGRSWGRVDIDISPTTDARGVTFSDSYVWAALQELGPDPASYSHKGNRFELMRTGDKGQNWLTQYVDDSAYIVRISFDKEEGWLTGLKYTGEGNFDTSLLVLHTLDQGEHWTDVSEHVNEIAAAKYKGHAGGWVEDITTEGPLAATIFTSFGDVFKTSDGGKSWQLVSNNEDALIEDMSACCLGFKPDKLRWVAGREHGPEGTASTLSVELGPNLWKKHLLGGIYLNDVQFLSETDVMACGFIFPKGILRDFDKIKGVILHSSDAGQNWSFVYQDAQAKTINALTTVAPKHVWAVGDRGLILHLENISL